MLVVISILVIIAAIGVPAMLAALDRSNRSTTQATLQSALGVVTEMRATRRSGEPLDHTDAPGWDPSIVNHAAIEYFVEEARESETTRKMLESLPLGDFDGDDRDEVWDAWERPVRYRASNDSGTEPRHGSPFFFSVGPDGEPGNFTDNNEPDNEAAEDDILSFQIEE